MIERLLDRLKVWHIIICSAVVYILATTSTLSMSGDDATYILISRAFAEKGFFGYIFSPAYTSSTLYNFLMPLLLAPFSAIAPEGYLWMKFIPILSSVLAAIALNLFLKGSISDRYRKAIVLLFALNPWIVEYSGLILTEMPFIASSLCAAAYAKKYDESGKGVYLIILVVSTASAVYLRPFGLAFIPAIALFFGMRKKYGELAVMAAALIVMLLPALYSAHKIFTVILRESIMRQELYSASYKGSSPADALYRAGYNLTVYIGNYLPDILMRPIVFGIYPRLADGSVNTIFIPKFMLGSAASLIMARGFVKTAYARIQLYHLYVIFYIALTMLVNVYVARYLLPLLPFLLFFFFSGIPGEDPPRANAEPAHHRWREYVPAASFAALFLISVVGVTAITLDARMGNIRPEAKSFIECNDWIKANTPRASVILSRKPSYTKLYTGRTVVGYFCSEDPDAQLEFIKKLKPDYVIVGDLDFFPHTAGALKEAARRHPGIFSLVYETKEEPIDYVYKVTVDRQ
ncbi:MAG: hypothetical protein NTY34_02920 [Candidatus Omnitrophica bacterium]|nr:hypothetical protein [Candidatus Omnitrophota bacterium]